MARANPEIKTEVRTYWHETSTGVSTTTDNLEISKRTYTSSNTPGFPNVKPLPFRSHIVDWAVRNFGVLDYYQYTSPTNWARRKATSKYFGVSVPAITGEITNTEISGQNPADFRARARAIQQVQRIKVNVAQNIAEYRQVHSMFGDTTRRFVNAYRALRHGDVRRYIKHVPLSKRHQHNLLNRGPMDVRRSAPSIWLESQYGWLPLLADIHDGITQFHSRVESGYPIRAIGTATTHDTQSRSGNGSGQVSYNGVCVRRFKAKYIIEYEVDATYLANMDDWGLTNPLLLAWELLPYSFVVDWFIPVGDWLSQVPYQLGLYYRRGMKANLAQAIQQRWYYPFPTNTVVKKAVGNDRFETIRFRRDLLGGFPSPGFPSIDKDGLRGKRIANALALLAMAFDRPIRRS